MRFAVAAALLATGAMASYEAPQSVVYETQIHTVTDCGPEVPDCPGKTTTEAYPEVPTHEVTYPEVPTYEEPEVPEPTPETPVYEQPTHEQSYYHPVPTPSQPGYEEPLYPAPTPEPACPPSHSVTAVTKSYTTVLTSVEYSTIEVPCSTEVPEVPEVPTYAPVPPPSYTHVPPAGNTTVPTPPPTAGAAGLAGSAFLAAIAGVAALVL